MTAYAAPESSRLTARQRKRGSVFRVFGFVKNSAAESDYAAGLVVFIKLHYSVAY